MVGSFLISIFPQKSNKSSIQKNIVISPFSHIFYSDLFLKNKASMAAIKAISKSCKKDGDIVWNFTKFLVDRDWNVIKRCDPTFKPEDMEKEILELL